MQMQRLPNSTRDASSRIRVNRKHSRPCFDISAPFAVGAPFSTSGFQILVAYFGNQVKRKKKMIEILIENFQNF